MTYRCYFRVRIWIDCVGRIGSREQSDWKQPGRKYEYVGWGNDVPSPPLRIAKRNLAMTSLLTERCKRSIQVHRSRILLVVLLEILFARFLV